MVSASKIKLNAISTLSNFLAERSLDTTRVAHDMLHVISTRCDARDLHTNAPWQLGDVLGTPRRALRTA